MLAQCHTATGRASITEKAKLTVQQVCEGLEQKGWIDLGCYPDTRHRENTEFCGMDASIWIERAGLTEDCILVLESALNEAWSGVKPDFEKFLPQDVMLKLFITRRRFRARRSHSDYKLKFEEQLAYWSRHHKRNRYIWIDIHENRERTGGDLVVCQFTVPEQGGRLERREIAFEQLEGTFSFRYSPRCS